MGCEVGLDNDVILRELFSAHGNSCNLHIVNRLTLGARLDERFSICGLVNDVIPKELFAATSN